jgi:FHS family L-fucose permease-like MFS transporter
MVPNIPDHWASSMTSFADHAAVLRAWLSGWFETNPAGKLCISDKGAANLGTVAFALFLLGRLVGSWLLKRLSAHKVLGTFAVFNVLATFLIFCNVGWLSVACVFASYFFMSIMFPTIFALGIFGLGNLTKKASSFIVMAIMGGAILPKLMGYVADQYNMSRSFIVPLACFVFIAFYGFNWPRLSKAQSLHLAPVADSHPPPTPTKSSPPALD